MIKITKKKNPNLRNEDNVANNNPIVDPSEDTNNKVISHNNSNLSNINMIDTNVNLNLSDKKDIKIFNDNMNIPKQDNITITNPLETNDSNLKNEKLSDSYKNNDGEQQPVKRRIIPTFLK